MRLIKACGAGSNLGLNDATGIITYILLRFLTGIECVDEGRGVYIR